MNQYLSGGIIIGLIVGYIYGKGIMKKHWGLIANIGIFFLIVYLGILGGIMATPEY